jgi:hypothetical protein
MTGNGTDRRTEIEALDALLASCGADRTRWPAHARLKFASLVATDPEAQRLVKEAAALDSVLDRAPAPVRPSDALAERIVATAIAGARDRDPRASDIRLPTRSRPSAAGAGRGISWARMRDVSAMPWPAAALLAASLVIGAFAGTSGVLDQALVPIAEVAASDSDMEADASQLAFGDDAADLYAEETL